MNIRMRTALIELLGIVLITFLLYSYYGELKTIVWLIPIIGIFRILRNLSGTRSEKEECEEVSLFPYQVLYMLIMIGAFYLVMEYFNG